MPAREKGVQHEKEKVSIAFKIIIGLICTTDRTGYAM